MLKLYLVRTSESFPTEWPTVDTYVRRSFKFTWWQSGAENRFWVGSWLRYYLEINRPQNYKSCRSFTSLSFNFFIECLESVKAITIFIKAFWSILKHRRLYDVEEKKSNPVEYKIHNSFSPTSALKHQDISSTFLPFIISF